MEQVELSRRTVVFRVREPGLVQVSNVSALRRVPRKVLLHSVVIDHKKRVVVDGRSLDAAPGDDVVTRLLIHQLVPTDPAGRVQHTVQHDPLRNVYRSLSTP